MFVPVYDAVKIAQLLELPCVNDGPVPQIQKGGVIVYYPGCSLANLLKSKAEIWLDREDEWELELGTTAGYYEVLVVPESNCGRLELQLEQLRIYGEEWNPAPVAVAALALIAHLAWTGDSLLGNNLGRCLEKTSRGDAYILGMCGKGLNIYDLFCDDLGGRVLFLIAARKC